MRIETTVKGRSLMVVSMLMVISLMAAMMVAGATASPSNAATTSTTYTVKIDDIVKAVIKDNGTYQQRVGKGCHRVVVSSSKTTTNADGTSTSTSGKTVHQSFCGSRLVTVTVTDGKLSVSSKTV
ncbi:MAG: hypothetical protein M3P49_13720 [Actinomycetota bacterium]|nr:hypothetical protein [Actinomycetota bacterium]